MYRQVINNITVRVEEAERRNGGHIEKVLINISNTGSFRAPHCILYA
jgi:hypothetical protein